MLRAKAAVNRIDHDISQAREAVRQRRERMQKQLQTARRTLRSAQSEVGRLEKLIRQNKAKVQRRRDSNERKLASARVDLRQATREVNKLQGSINDQKTWIRSLKGQIRTKKRWLDRRKWYEKTWAGPEYAAYAAAKNTEIGWAQGKIGSLEAAKFTANGVLDLSRQFLRKLERTIDTFPLELDPTVGPVIASYEVADRSLGFARNNVRGLENSLEKLTVDVNPVVAGLIVGREAAELGLNVADEFLEGVQISMGALGEVGGHIVKFGMSGLVDVKRAEFRANLMASSQGQVLLALSVSFMNQTPEELDIRFDFSNTTKGVKSLVRSLID